MKNSMPKKSRYKSKTTPKLTRKQRQVLKLARELAQSVEKYNRLLPQIRDGKLIVDFSPADWKHLRQEAVELCTMRDKAKELLRLLR